MFEFVLLPHTKRLLKKLRREDLPKGTYLAGGTAVALRLGHRRSADLDFFTPTEFVETQWEEKLKRDFGFVLLKRDWQTLIGTIGRVKVSLFTYPYASITPQESYHKIPIASLPDLAAMKLDTILGRGTKRDLIDIYFLAQTLTFKELFAFYQKKYHNLEERELMIKKSLVFFDDADKEEIPDMLIPINWSHIKKWFVREVKSFNL